MARKSVIAREIKREKLVARYADKRAALKAAGDWVGLDKLHDFRYRDRNDP